MVVQVVRAGHRVRAAHRVRVAVALAVSAVHSVQVQRVEAVLDRTQAVLRLAQLVAVHDLVDFKRFEERRTKVNKLQVFRAEFCGWEEREAAVSSNVFHLFSFSFTPRSGSAALATYRNRAWQSRRST